MILSEAGTEAMSEQDFSSDVMSPAWHIMHILWGLIPSRVVSVAAKLGIADLLASGPSTADELARATGTHAGALRRLLSALTSLQVFSEDASGAYRNTTVSETLRSDHPHSVRALAMLWGRPIFLRSWQSPVPKYISFAFADPYFICN